MSRQHKAPPSKRTKRGQKKGAQASKVAVSTNLAESKRRIKLPTYRSFRLQKRIRHTKTELTGGIRLFVRSLLVLKKHWRLFFAITLVYGLLNIILVRGLVGGVDLMNIKHSLQGAFKGQGGQLSTGVTLFVYLLGSAGTSTNTNASVYQTMLLIIVSLAVIWALRQVYNETAVRMRDAFYRGVYPLVPFLLVLLVIGLQLLPIAIGGTLYSLVITNGIAVNLLEKMLWALQFFVLAVASLYMICSSVFALYVVTLSDMTPLKALRSARQLVYGRRWIVLRKLLFLPFALLICAGIIMVPLIIFATVIAQWVFFALTMLGLIVIHGYMYALYRELLV